MKTIAFHSNQLGIRGTEVALYDYARYNEEILGNKSYIISCAKADLATLKKFQNRFEVFLYDKFQDCFNFVEDKNIGYVYYIKAGDNDGKLIPGVKNLIHVVFQNKDVHGDKYAYVSNWLASKMDMEDSYVPHIVSLPEPQTNYREQLGIPEKNVVVGRYGGYGEFDLPFVYEEIYNVLQLRSDATFLFMNTRPFGPDHPNIIHVNGTPNLQNKSNFINTCDYMIHGRNHGESFGLAICEFLYGGKPVISWKNGLDKHHINLLGDKGIWYETPMHLNGILNSLNKQHEGITSYECKMLVEQFSPKNVMERFDKIFLK
jgi:hypothetical protein